MDVVELDVSEEGRGLVGAVVLDLVFGVEDFEDAVGGDHSHLHFVEFVGNLSQGVEEHSDVHGVGEDVAEGCGGVAAKDAVSGVPDDEAESQGGEYVGDGEEDGVVPDGFYPGFSVLVVDLGEFEGFDVFAVEKLYDFHSCDALLDEGVDVCDLVSDFFEGDLHFSLEDAGDEQEDWHHEDDYEGQAPVCVEHEAEDDCHFEQVGGDHEESLAEYFGDLFHVGDGTGYELPDGCVVEVFHSEGEHVAEKFYADVFDDVLSEPVCPVDEVELC